MTASTQRIGIDFGTANTVVARWDGGRAEPVALPGYDVVREPVPGLLQRVVPSVIGYRESGARLSAVLGAGALSLPPDAGTVFRSMKSHQIGRAHV